MGLRTEDALKVRMRGYTVLIAHAGHLDKLQGRTLQYQDDTLSVV